MKRCCICGKPFEPTRRSQVTCLDPHCRKARYKRTQAEYGKSEHNVRGVDKRTYKREKQREYRARAKGEVYVPNFPPKPKETPLETAPSSYAERQMQKSLALAGKVKVTL